MLEVPDNTTTNGTVVGLGEALESQEENIEDDVVFQDLLQHLHKYEKDDDYVPHLQGNHQYQKRIPEVDNVNPIVAAFNR